MNADPANTPPTHMSREERSSLMFANMVIQQTNMAMVFLGKVPHPETGETIQNLEAAQMFIDQIEMLEAKTKGNLDKREEALLRQSLTELRMAFVDAVRSKTPASASAPSAQSQQQQPAPPSPPPSAAPDVQQTESPAAETESRKRFSKKY